MNTHEDFEADEAIAECETKMAAREAKLTARIAELESEVIIAKDGDRHWAVVAMVPVPWLECDNPFDVPGPTVVCRDLATRAAAEVARGSVLRALTAEPYFDASTEHYDAAGRVLSALRCEGSVGDDAIGLASRLVYAVTNEHPRAQAYFDDPFGEAPF
jgi:hypothetical protein